MKYEFDDNEIQLPAEIAEAVETAQLPKAYEDAKKALAACESLDEVRDWANKAEAIASYARQAEDETLENTARRIKHRALRKLGELLQSYDGRGRKKKPEGHPVFTRAEAAKAAGVSENQSRISARIYAIPDDEFEAAVECPHPPGNVDFGANDKDQPGTGQSFQSGNDHLGKPRCYITAHIREERYGSIAALQTIFCAA